MIKIYILIFILLCCIPKTEAKTFAAGDARLTLELSRLRNIDSKTLTDKAFEYLNRDMADSALVYYSVMAERTDQDAETIRYRTVAYENLGVLYMSYYYDYHKAYEYLLEAQELSEKNNDKHRQAYIYLDMANIFDISTSRDNEDRSQVYDALVKAYECAKVSKDRELLATCATNIYDVTLQQHTKTVAADVLAISGIKDIAKVKQGRYIIIQTDAMKKYVGGNYAEAAELFVKASENVDEDILKERYRVNAIFDASLLYSYAGQSEKAIALLKQCESSVKEHGYKDYLPLIYHTLAKIYRNIGESGKAEKYDYRYMKADKELMEECNLSNIDNVLFARELNKATTELTLMGERQYYRDIIIVIVVLIVIIVTGLLVRLSITYRKLKGSYKSLYEKNVELYNNTTLTLPQSKDKNQATTVAKDDSEYNKVEQTPQTKYQQSNLTQQDIQDIWQRILEVMEHSDEIYQQGFTIDQMAQLVHSRSRYVSQVVNEVFGNNFNVLLNKYRIREACRRFDDVENYGKYSIEGVAMSVGFKSRTTFATTFKAATGLTPSVYQSLAKNH